MNKKLIAIFAGIVVIAIILCTQITFFVIQPIGAIPEGKTLVILRMNKTKFIDSADAMCKRELDGVSLLCRAGMMGAIASKGKILIRLPYSEWLYRISKNGDRYDR